MFHELSLTIRDTQSWVAAKLLPANTQPDDTRRVPADTRSVPTPAPEPVAATHEKAFHDLFEALMKVVHRFPGLSKEIDEVLLQFQVPEAWN